MSLLHHELNWEYTFTEEAIAIEEKLADGSLIINDYSRLYLALQSHILEWEKYKNWYADHFPCGVIDRHLGPSDIENLFKSLNKTQNPYPEFSEVFYLGDWQNKKIICGVDFPKQLQNDPHILFYLCHPDVLEKLVDYQNNMYEIESAFSQFEQNHIENSSKARKFFDAYIVLKIENNKTFLHSADQDFLSENMSTDIFIFDLKKDNVFSQCDKTHSTTTIKLADLNIGGILDFNYASITPLKRGKITLGFLVGLKVSACEDEDIQTLESLSKAS